MKRHASPGFIKNAVIMAGLASYMAVFSVMAQPAPDDGMSPSSQSRHHHSDGSPPLPKESDTVPPLGDNMGGSGATLSEGSSPGDNGGPLPGTRRGGNDDPPPGGGVPRENGSNDK